MSFAYFTIISVYTSPTALTSNHFNIVQDRDVGINNKYHINKNHIHLHIHMFNYIICAYYDDNVHRAIYIYFISLKMCKCIQFLKQWLFSFCHYLIKQLYKTVSVLIINACFRMSVYNSLCVNYVVTISARLL